MDKALKCDCLPILNQTCDCTDEYIKFTVFMLKYRLKFYDIFK